MLSEGARVSAERVVTEGGARGFDVRSQSNMVGRQLTTRGASAAGLIVYVSSATISTFLVEDYTDTDILADTDT